MPHAVALIASFSLLLLAPHAVFCKPGLWQVNAPALAAAGAHNARLGRARAPVLAAASGLEPETGSADDVSVLERESVRNTAETSGFGRRNGNGQTQVYGAWLDDDVVGNRGDASGDALSYGVACMRAGSYAAAVTAFQEAVQEAGGEASMKGGQMCVWLAQGLYAAGEPQAAISLLARLEKGHSGGNVRKAASEIKYILEAPELKLDENSFVQIPESIQRAERPGRATPLYAKMEKKPDKYSLEWYMLQKEPKQRKQKVDPAGGVAAVALVGLALYAAALLVVP